MNFPIFIAKRYLISKKSQNIINIISKISIIGISVGTIALIVVLSIFNGLEGMLEGMFNSFDPDIKITVKEGKSFRIDNTNFDKIRNNTNVAYFSEIVESRALLESKDKKWPATIKGVDSNFKNICNIDSILIDGEYKLKENNHNFAVIGAGIRYYMNIGMNLFTPIKIHAIKRTAKFSATNPIAAISKKVIYPSGVFSVQIDIDNEIMLVPISFARELFDYKSEVTSIEINAKDKSKIQSLKNEIKEVLKDKFVVQDKYEQHELTYKMMKSEKLYIFIILSFITFLVSLTIIGSITMLIIEKKEDISIFRSFGMTEKSIKKIFLFHGIFLSLSGISIGLIIGGLISWLQQTYGFVKLNSGNSFIVDSYPVEIQFNDFIYVTTIVLVIGFIAAWTPVRFMSKNLDLK